VQEDTDMETLRYAVYSPPAQGMPYLAVGLIDGAVECLLAADSHEEALEKLDLEMDILRIKTRLFEEYARDRTQAFTEEVQTTASASISTS